MNPTAPPESLGRPSAGRYRMAASSARSSSSGSPPTGRSVVSPPFRIETVVASAQNLMYGSKPMKEYRAHFSPPSTLSRRKWSSGNRAEILRYAETGVSRSAWNSCQTGMTYPARASDRNASFVGRIIPLLSPPHKNRVDLHVGLELPDRLDGCIPAGVRAHENPEQDPLLPPGFHDLGGISGLGQPGLHATRRILVPEDAGLQQERLLPSGGRAAGGGCPLSFCVRTDKRGRPRLLPCKRLGEGDAS